jgi:STE24 endopeptidase
MQILNLLNLGLMGVVVWLTVKIPEIHTAFGFEQINYGFATILTGIALGVIQPLTGILTNAHSRRAEYRADHQAVKEGYGDALISGLKILGKENFTHLAPAKLLVVLNYSHPPLSQRIEAIEKAQK